MECPYCQNEKVLPVKDRLAVEPQGSLLRESLYPGERPSAYGTQFLIGGGASAVLALVLWNASPFRNAFWDFGGGWPAHLRPAGWLVLAVLVLGGLFGCWRGLMLKVNAQKSVGLWERKQRFFESGIVCASCMKAWLPGLEEHPLTVSSMDAQTLTPPTVDSGSPLVRWFKISFWYLAIATILLKITTVVKIALISNHLSEPIKIWTMASIGLLSSTIYIFILIKASRSRSKNLLYILIGYAVIGASTMLLPQGELSNWITWIFRGNGSIFGWYYSVVSLIGSNNINQSVLSLYSDIQQIIAIIFFVFALMKQPEV